MDGFNGWGDDTEEGVRTDDGDDDDKEGDDGYVYDWTVMDTSGQEKDQYIP